MSLPGIGGQRPSGTGRQVLKRALLSLAVLSAAVLAYAQFLLGSDRAEGALIVVRPAWVAFDGGRYAGCQFGYLSGSESLSEVIFVAIGAGERPDSLIEREPVRWGRRFIPPVDEMLLDTWKTVHLTSTGFKTGMGFLWPVAKHPSDRGGAIPMTCQVQGRGTMRLVPEIPVSQRVRDARAWLAVIAGLSAAIGMLMRGGGGA